MAGRRRIERDHRGRISSASRLTSPTRFVLGHFVGEAPRAECCEANVDGSKAAADLWRAVELLAELEAKAAASVKPKD